MPAQQARLLPAALAEGATHESHGWPARDTVLRRRVTGYCFAP